MGVSIVMGVPQKGWFIMGNPMSMDDDWRTPILGNLRMGMYNYGFVDM